MCVPWPRQELGPLVEELALLHGSRGRTAWA
jgi:hypothetical protein